MVYADPQGKIFSHPFLLLVAREGAYDLPIREEDLIPMPEGTKLFTMPGRSPVGWDASRKACVVFEEEREGSRGRPLAVSAFLPPGYARAFLPATRLMESYPVLPLWAYAAVGWAEGQFWVAGFRVDHSGHWDPCHYDDRSLLPLVRRRVDAAENRLLRHLERCALGYHCLAAKNLFYGRWECPLPVSPVCNADCVGCLSLQPEGKITASHERLNFLPTVEEVLEIAVPHLESADEAVVSFGQGCEGEPLLQAPLMEEVIREIRKSTARGVIHVNTNGSKPASVEKLCEAGLDSIRVSLNATRDSYYERYYRPKGYSLAQVKESLKIATSYGIYTSINLLTFPGFTDRADELASLLDFIHETNLTMVQWKNLNIDPDQYQSLLGTSSEQILGMRAAIGELRCRFPDLDIGYFNRPSGQIQKTAKTGLYG